MEPIHVPGSKSITHRAMVLAAACDRPVTLTGALRSDDTDATLDCLRALGAEADAEGTTLQFRPGASRFPDGPLDCRNAGTALRLLSAQAALADRPITLTGDRSLQSRPNGPLLEALASLGARIQGGPQAPFSIQGPLQPGTVQMPPRISSQYLSALLLALPRLQGPSELHAQAPVSSSPYLDLSLDVAAAFGLRIQEAPQAAPGRAFHMPGSDTPRADTFAIEADWSTAAFPLAAGALLSEARVAGLRADSRQGDRRILERLADFGVQVGSDLRAQRTQLHGAGTVDITDTPDMFPILTILAAAAKGTTTFTGGAALRHKESDRIRAMATGLSAMGIDVQERPDGLVVHGGTFGGANVDSHADHRVHMAFAIAAHLADGPVTVSDPECVAVSYPGFHDDLARIAEGA